MSDVTRKHSQFFSHLFPIVEHHRFTSILLMIAAIWLFYMLSVPSQEPLRPTALSGMAEKPNELHANAKKAFFFLESSQALTPEEYEARAMYIIAQLKTLRELIDADNVFVFSFHPDTSPEGDPQDLLASNTFEVNRDDVSPHLYLVQDLSSFAWEHVRNAQIGVYPASGSEGYGIELYDRQKTLIGFLGASSLKKADTFLMVSEEPFKELARKVEIALAYPLADFQKLQAL